ncbi:unnamed protein product [Urochloa humidicola]
MDVPSVITSFIMMLKKEILALIRIEFLAALATVMFLVMFLMDIYRFQFRRSIITTIMEVIRGLSTQIVAYLVGAMNSKGFYYHLFPVWAVLMVSLRDSIDYLSGYSIMDHENNIKEVPNVIIFMGEFFFDNLFMRGLEFADPIWWLLTILQLRSMYRSFAQRRAMKSLWHGRSSEFLPDYLYKEADDQCDGSNNFNNTQKHPVYGEPDQKTNIKQPQYVLQLDDTNHESLITLEKIWESSGPLLNSGSSCRYKDMSLAFTLSRLLRCRLEDVPLHAESIPMTRNLITSELLGDQHAKLDVEVAQAAGRAFSILDLEIAFVRDYFYTFYPMVFWRGLFSLSFILLQSIVTFAVAFWLAVVIIWVNGDHGRHNVHVITPCVFLFFLMFKEVWEMVTYLLSNWTRLLLVCKYVQNQCWCLRNVALTENLTRLCFTSKIVDPWHGRIDQYQFLQSCTYKPTFWKLVHTVTLGVTPEKYDGKKSGGAIKIPECVKAAVLQELRCLDLSNITGDQLPIYAGHPLPRYSLREFSKYEWVFHLHTCSQVILVWHIATSLCEIKLALDNQNEYSNPGFLCSIWPRLKKLGSCSSQPFLLDENILQQGRLQTNYRIANSLSRYCAYLQAFQSELLPDSFMVPQMVFEKTLKYACEKLKDCDTTQCRYDTLKAIAQETMQDSEDGKLSMNIVEQGSILANDLIEQESEDKRWDILARVWAGLIVHIAPSWNAEAHKRNLKYGGEFITLIWALLWHCGIEKSSMWHGGHAYERNTQAPQEDSSETRNSQFVHEQASEDGIETFGEDETSNFGTDIEEQAQLESEAKKNNNMHQENSSEIRNSQFVQKQANEDGIETSKPDTSNFRTDRAEQSQKESEAKNDVPQENSIETRNPQFVQAEAYEDEVEIYEESVGRNSRMGTVEQAQRESEEKDGTSQCGITN